MKKQLVLIALACLSAKPLHAWTASIYNATPYSAKGYAGRVATSTASSNPIAPYTEGGINMEEWLMDSIYAELYVPKVDPLTGLPGEGTETIQVEGQSGIGQRVCKDFAIFGPDSNGKYQIKNVVF